MKKVIFLPIIILTLIGAGFYFINTFDVNTKGVVEIVHPEGIIDDGLISRAYYMQYEILPTETTQAGTVYRVVVDNGSIEQTDKVVWSQVELDVEKAKLIKHKLSEDEFIALGMNPRYEVTVDEIRSERDGTYLMAPVLYICLLVLAAMCGYNFLRKPVKKKQVNYIRPFRNKALETVPVKLSDEDRVKRCLECNSLKSVNGTLKCNLERCKY